VVILQKLNATSKPCIVLTITLTATISSAFIRCHLHRLSATQGPSGGSLYGVACLIYPTALLWGIQAQIWLFDDCQHYRHRYETDDREKKIEQKAK
jgi:hypothetical protein